MRNLSLLSAIVVLNDQIQFACWGVSSKQHCARTGEKGVVILTASRSLEFIEETHAPVIAQASLSPMTAS
jgi:regulator of RNase E activity RraA